MKTLVILRYATEQQQDRHLSTIRLVFEKQWLHALLLAGLLYAAMLASKLSGFSTGELWGIETCTWFWLGIAVVVAHQTFVWFCWRMELHLKLLTRVLGDRGFAIYAAMFSILGSARVVVVFLLAISNQDTLDLNHTLLRTLAVVAAVPAGYLFYSVARYFGFRRAFGIDHFDPATRSIPFVRQGIFRFTNNGMYVYGFLLIWVPGLWSASVAALCLALFNHLYIWVHYYSTELPDIRRIYGSC